jgi:excisionase family DNA binding protein
MAYNGLQEVTKMDSEYLTPEEIAIKLKVHEDTIRRWLRTGELKGIKIGKRQWRIRKADLDAYLSGQNQGNT